MHKNTSQTSESPSQVTAAEADLTSNNSLNRRKALHKIGKYSTYVAPILIASISGKVRAES